MSKFYTIFEQVVHSLLKEGGNAIAGVDRVKKDVIFKTVDAFKEEILEKLFGFSPSADDVFLLGSTGKKEESGDIDIGIDINSLKDKNVLENLVKLNELCARNGYVSCINSITYRMLHIAYPQVGEKDKKVQIDVLFTENPDFTKFYMSSPAENESRYKGAHRNALLNAILYVETFKLLEKDGNGDVVRWKQLECNDEGLCYVTKTLLDENGERLYYKDTAELLEPAYAKTSMKMLVSAIPEYIVKFIVGKEFKLNDVDTFEKLFSIVSNDDKFKYKEKKVDILKKCAKDLKLAEKRLEFPEELSSFL